MRTKIITGDVETQNPAVFEEDPIGEALRAELRQTIRTVVEEELKDAIGANRYVRVMKRLGYRNGTIDRTLSTSIGQAKFKMPRALLFNDDGSETEWKSKVVPRYQRRAKAVDDALLACYLSGANTRRIRQALEPILAGVPMSRSTISRLVKKLKKLFDAWKKQSLKSATFRYVYADAINMKMRLAGKVTRIPILAVVGVRDTGEKELLTLEQMGSESSGAWTQVFRDLVDRGLNRPALVIIDGNPGLRDAVETIWPHVRVQRCTVHKLRNLMDKAPKHAQEEVKADYHAIVYAKSRQDAVSAYDAFVRKWSKTLASVVRSLEEAGHELLTFFEMPEAHWIHLRTTNVIERANGEFRRRVKTQGSLPDEGAVLVLLFGMYATGQIRMRRINSPEELKAIELEKVLTEGR